MNELPVSKGKWIKIPDMETADKLGKYMKELPYEQPSDQFTRMVMGRVMAEAKLSTGGYHPLISRKSWMLFGAGFLLLLIVSVLMPTYFPGNENPSGWISLFRLDYSGAWKPLLTITESLKNIPVTFLGALAAFTLLVTAERLMSLDPRR